MAIKLIFTLSLCVTAVLFPGRASSQEISIKVITVAMFESDGMTGDKAGEAQLWYERDSLFQEMAIPGSISPLYYNRHGQGLIITGAGVTNAASTIMALGLNKNLDLTETYFLVAGIAGISPEAGTIGSAVWTDWVVDAGMCHAIDAREIPDDWEFSRFRLRCEEPWCEGGSTIGTEVFRLDSTLVQRAYQLTKNVDLADSRVAQKIRKSYPKESAAGQKPAVTIGSNIAGSTYLYGKINSEWAGWWVGKWTREKGTYFVTNMEDNGIMTAFNRLSEAGIISYDRIMILRTASNFDQPLPGNTSVESMNDSWAGQIAVENAYRVGSVVVHDILNDWDSWNGD